MNSAVHRMCSRRNSFMYNITSTSQNENEGIEDSNGHPGSDFLTGHGVRPVSDVNENFSTPVNIYTEQNGFKEDSEQPASTQNTGKVSLWNTVLDPDGNTAYYWMGLVTLAVLYNLAIIILRLTFTDMATDWSFLFFCLDAVSDAIYLLDMFVQFRVAYYDDGCLVTDPKKLVLNYKRQTRFVADVIATVPLQYVANISIGCLRCFFIRFEFLDLSSPYIIMLRLPRLIKTFIVVRFFEVTDSRTSTPNRIRAIKLSLYLWLVIHWIGCIYYMLSEYEGRGSNEWVYPSGEEYESFSRKYIRCLYWSMLILTTIGERPSPYTDLEYVFTGMTFVIGVFVFAAVVGNVGDVISNMNASRQDYQARMDQIKFYMNHRNVPEHLQNRVKRWAEYSWTRTQAIDEPHLLQLLPERLRTEIAIQVHLETLKKVKLFEECEEGLLRELVLKLKPQTFSPNDYICRQGEIGREMFIINHGQVEIIIPREEDGKKIVVSTLVRGNYFGEISLLKLDDGHNRRTADVRSVGYSELLCLSRKDLIAALAEYPDARRVLEKIARERILTTKTISKFKEAVEQETRKENTRKRRGFCDVVKTHKFKSLKTMQVPETTDLGKLAADLRELGNKISKLQDEKDRDKIIRCLRKKLRENEKELERAFARIQYLESALELRASSSCPCDGEFCVSPLHKNSDLHTKPKEARLNTCSLEILPSQDNKPDSKDRRRPTSCQLSAGIQTLPVRYRVPRGRELPSLSLFPLKRKRSLSEPSRHTKTERQSLDISLEGKFEFIPEPNQTSSGYLSETDTLTFGHQTDIKPTLNKLKMESYSDQSEIIPLSGSDSESENSSDESMDDDPFFSQDHVIKVASSPKPPIGRSKSLPNRMSRNNRKYFTVKIKETFV